MTPFDPKVRGWRRLFRLPARRARVDDEVREEFRFHLEERIEQFVESGLSRAEAEREVRRRFGDLEEYRQQARRIDEETLRRRSRMDISDTFRRELARAARALRRAPAFAGIAFLTLALGIGGATAIFTVLDAVVLRPLPYRSAGELVSLLHPATVPGNGERKWGLSSGGYYRLREQTRTLSDVGMYRTWSVTVTSGGEAELARVGHVTASVFTVLGARPAVGRLLSEIDDRPDSTRRVVLSYEYWRRRFGAQQSVVGSMLVTSDASYEIIGVAEPGLTLPMPGPFSSSSNLAGFGVDLWLPLKLNPAGPHWNSHPFVGVGRLRPGSTVADANAEFSALTRRLPELVPNAYSASFMSQYNFRGEAAPLKHAVLGPSVPKALWMLFGAVLLVLGVSAANVANLFIVRMEARRRDTAVRSALGSGTGHLAVHFLSESLLLCGVAGVAAVWMARAGLGALLAIAPTDIPRLGNVSLGWPSVAFAVSLALLCGVVLGLVPLIRRQPAALALRDDARGMTASRGRRRLRRGLVVGQMAMALVLLASAGVMLRSFQALRRVTPGFDAANVLAFDVSLPFTEYDTREKAAEFHRALQARLTALPGVTDVGALTSLPLEGYGTGCTVVFRENEPYGANEPVPCVSTPIVMPGAIEALHIAVRGRTPDWSDVDARTQGVVLTKALAEHLWPGQDPVGKGINSNGPGSTTWYRVVGVIPELRAEALDQPPTEAVFYAASGFVPNRRSGALNDMTYVVRTNGVRVESIIPAARRALASLNPRVPFVNPRPMAQVMARSMARTSFIMLLLGVAAAMALSLSAVGTYGVISHVVAQRRSEIGVRIALGAPAGLVARQVVAESLRLALAGVLIGVAGAWATGRLLRSLLFNVSPTDPLVFAVVSLVLVAIGALAAWIPARRAARVDPVEALRESS